MNTQMTLRQKLFQIQLSAKTFAQELDSEKKTNGKSDYRYTPGWRIVEHIRTKMDELGVMLDCSDTAEEHAMISTTIPLVGPEGMIYYKKEEMYVTLTQEYTWVDTETGEKIGPIAICGAGCNGTDKSTASAHSFCERYFLLKQFHITTRELGDEPDAHDVTSVPGTLPQTYRPAEQQRTTGRGYTSQQQPAWNNPAAQQQTYQTNATTPQDKYEAAVAELACYGENTTSFAQVMQKHMVELNIAGYNTADPNFAATLKNHAIARRMNRTSAYAS